MDCIKLLQLHSIQQDYITSAPNIYPLSISTVLFESPLSPVCAFRRTPSSYKNPEC